jgi:hypothetical protein
MKLLASSTSGRDGSHGCGGVSTIQLRFDPSPEATIVPRQNTPLSQLICRLAVRFRVNGSRQCLVAFNAPWATKPGKVGDRREVAVIDLGSAPTSPSAPSRNGLPATDHQRGGPRLGLLLLDSGSTTSDRCAMASSGTSVDPCRSCNKPQAGRTTRQHSYGSRRNRA